MYKAAEPQGALRGLASTKFVSAHRNLVFPNRNVNCASTTLSEFSRPWSNVLELVTFLAI